jgi:thiosulfate dehydrogenase [quinone] large subunit
MPWESNSWQKDVSRAYALPTMEVLIGAAVAIGFRTRVALFAGTVLMLALMFGTTHRQDWATVGIQLNYSFIYCLLLAGIRFLTTTVRTAFFIAVRKIL